MSRLVSVTVDLDPLGAYHRIHGLPLAAAEHTHRLTTVGLPRFLELFDRLGIAATFFVVGGDLADPTVTALLGEALERGHEVANHTASHPYDLLDWSAREQATEIQRGHELISAALGIEPVGFRSPGYQLGGHALGILSDRGYRYDSSLLPSLPYFAAKLTAMGLMRLGGRASRSRLHSPAVLLAPANPYRPAERKPWQRGRSSLVEIPAASLVAGVPLVGTFLGGFSTTAARALGRFLQRRSFVTIEFHGIDLVALKDGGLQTLAGKQPGLRVPLERRRAAFEALLSTVLAGAEADTLAGVAERYNAGLL